MLGAAWTLPEKTAVADPEQGVRRRWTVRLGPGVLQLLTQARGVDGPDPEPYQRTCLGCPLVDRHARWVEGVDGALGRWEHDPPKRGEIVAWSSKSRANMVRTMNSLDWAPIVDGEPGWRPVMLTLTLPGEWEHLAPDGATFKRRLTALYKRWERRWGRYLSCVWKLEFQRRGAPHAHIYCSAPVGREFREWLSVAWAEVANQVRLPDRGKDSWEQFLARVEQAAGRGVRDNVAAGTGVDWGEGMRATDPKRLGVYFAKRSATHNVGADKEYQHIVPEAWRAPGKGPGRFWGYRGLQRATEDVELDEAQFVALRRLARRWLRAQDRTRTVRRRVVDFETGEVKPGRKVTRRYRLRSLATGRRTGGFVIFNDAPAWLTQAARWAALQT